MHQYAFYWKYFYFHFIKNYLSALCIRMYFLWLPSHDFQFGDPTLIWPAKPLHVKLVREGVSFGPFEGVQIHSNKITWLVNSMSRGSYLIWPLCVRSCQGQDGDSVIGRDARGPRTNQVNKIRVLILRIPSELLSTNQRQVQDQEKTHITSVVISPKN